ncbi:DUF2986 domain-containing protein [Thalassotalea litorea]|uniref:DUF2986 domain-containing protein n=1 Tax=Thalassotalea litorea TaxID=2020715 RepID=A0A5R9IPP0_9GAMM|nr:DUF2986 domain-containing protein [Thalassotalea litorea]TLU65186.1 DUF2986 domain-containing protein [Thalassotalea litorea]
MNRKKKIKSILMAKKKKANKKLQNKSQNKGYVAKAEREKLTDDSANASTDTIVDSSNEKPTASE